MVKCKICGQSEGHKFITGIEMMLKTHHEFEYFQCGTCECLQIIDIPENLSDYYPDDYYSFVPYEEEGKKQSDIYKFRCVSTILCKTLIQKIFNLILPVKKYQMLRGLGIDKSTKILDVGSGNGSHFLYPLREAGFKNLLGIDPFIEGDITYDNGLMISKKNVFDIEGHWDIISYLHSFEHLPNPQEHMAKIAEILNEKGLAIIATPVVPSIAFDQYGSNWYQMDPPRHLFVHSKKSMEIIAKENSLAIDHIEYNSGAGQFIRSEAYKYEIEMEKPLRKNKFRKKMDKFLSGQKAKRANKLGQGDMAVFYLRKV